MKHLVESAKNKQARKYDLIESFMNTSWLDLICQICLPALNYSIPTVSK